MSESASLRDRLRADLTDDRSVTVSAMALALGAFVVVSIDSTLLPISGEFNAGFLLSLSLMDMAFAYDDYWPVEYRPRYAVLWALLFGVLTAGVFLGVYELGLSRVGNTAASIAAFLTAVGLQFGAGALYARVR